MSSPVLLHCLNSPCISPLDNSYQARLYFQSERVIGNIVTENSDGSVLDVLVDDMIVWRNVSQQTTRQFFTKNSNHHALIPWY